MRVYYNKPYLNSTLNVKITAYAVSNKMFKNE